MCGICGKIEFYDRPVEASLVKRMAATLHHRGPDDEGVYAKGSAGLGHKRLSVIDLTAAAHQPMTNETGTVWIVLNGEIYNYRDLKKELEQKGHLFRSHSDTEVVLHLYEQEGIGCVERLRGMFAFAIWDEGTRTLSLARDRVGKKPLFYYADADCLIFASEIKAILEDRKVERKPDFIAIHHYLTYQSVPAPFSAFQGIRKLPPAHYLVCRDGKRETTRYWNLSYLPKFRADTAAEVEGLEEELRERLREAVAVRLVSDVPLGAFLSGGVDSSVVVALMSGVMGRPVKTFSIGFQEEAYDELRYAKLAADRFGTEHTEFLVKPDAVDVLPKLVWHYNEPFADCSAIPSYYVAKLAREHVTVALNGDGGDESFAGYDRYRANELALYCEHIPRPLRNKLFPALAALLPASSDPHSFFWRLKRFSQTLAMSPELRNAHWLCHFDNRMKAGLYTEEFKRSTEGVDSFAIILEKYAQADADTFTDRTLFADVALYLADTLLVKMDVAAMANSLEARSPFLDHELMEFAARLPAHLKLHRGKTKIILKNAFRNILPADIIGRKKMGFGVPLDRWFRNELKEMAYDLLLRERCIARGYFNGGYVRRILDEHVSGRWNWHYQIYNLLMLELWHRTFIDRG
ncbi:MAG: asparagine synthase (glutamine-hydrolyzing) [Syntrophales bacterium]